jgi:hypothetical protein
MLIAASSIPAKESRMKRAGLTGRIPANRLGHF